MRQWKFTETQIVSIKKEADASRPVNAIDLLLRTQNGHILIVRTRGQEDSQTCLCLSQLC